MEITLKPYDGEDENQILHYIMAFFRAHHSQPGIESARADLADWTSEGHDFYKIMGDGQVVGFIHTSMRGPTVCWIEDIFVDENLRRQGIASKAIGLVEEVIWEKGVQGISMDVAPYNLPALKLYHRLGYDQLSIVTVRKDKKTFSTAHTEQIQGLEFRIKQYEE